VDLGRFEAPHGPIELLHQWKYGKDERKNRGKERRKMER